MYQQFSKLQALTFLTDSLMDINNICIDDDKHSFTYNEWFEAGMFGLMSDIVKSTKLSFTVFEIKNAIIGYAISSGSYTLNSDDSIELELFNHKFYYARAAIKGD
jgi:hypothetical protein